MSDLELEKILVSSCLLGKKVRYDGLNKQLVHPLLIKWQNQGRLYAICPEVSGGLCIPRAAAEIVQETRKVFTINGLDVTDAFILGANKALQLCQQQGIRFALLKESSPSCGSNFIYDGRFSGNKMVGQGICSQLLTKYGIHVFSEDSIEQLSLLLD